MLLRRFTRPGEMRELQFDGYCLAWKSETSRWVAQQVFAHGIAQVPPAFEIGKRRLRGFALFFHFFYSLFSRWAEQPCTQSGDSFSGGQVDMCIDVECFQSFLRRDPVQQRVQHIQGNHVAL